MSETLRRINLKKANVARADTIRYINRQIVLNYIREKEPISRASISHETALQRSTVSLIVDELKTRGLAPKSRPGHLSRWLTANGRAAGPRRCCACEPRVARQSALT